MQRWGKKSDGWHWFSRVRLNPGDFYAWLYKRLPGLMVTALWRDS